MFTFCPRCEPSEWTKKQKQGYCPSCGFDFLKEQEHPRDLEKQAKEDETYTRED